ncbi:hypothetical protein H2248_000087 [Termitomyces sp. 'cryptogamus']|nr:hypothetical protein H2248_000087 [Termitomyces sp. 'cryptogamus']
MAETLESLGHTAAAVELYTVMINRYEKLECFPRTMSRPIRIKRGACNARLGRLAEAEEDLKYVSKLPLSGVTRVPLKKRKSRLRDLRGYFGFKSSAEHAT